MVDRLGNINDAIISASKKAKLKDYKVVAYPEQKSLFKSFGSDIQSRVSTHFAKAELGNNYVYYQQLKGIQQMMRIPQARLPFIAEIK